MDATRALAFLRYPAYGLFHIASLEQSEAGGYLYDIVPVFPKYDAELKAGILTALKWAAEAEVIDWEAVLPSLPHSDAFRRAHLDIVLRRLCALPERTSGQISIRSRPTIRRPEK